MKGDRTEYKKGRGEVLIRSIVDRVQMGLRCLLCESPMKGPGRTLGLGHRQTPSQGHSTTYQYHGPIRHDVDVLHAGMFFLLSRHRASDYTQQLCVRGTPT